MISNLKRLIFGMGKNLSEESARTQNKGLGNHKPSATSDTSSIGRAEATDPADKATENRRIEITDSKHPSRNAVDGQGPGDSQPSSIRIPRQSFATNAEQASPIRNPTLNEEQMRVFRYVCSSRQNTFITGRAGSGKSHLLRQLVQYGQRQTVVVAPTGVAALNAGGTTIHKAFKFGIGFLNQDMIDAAFFRLRNDQGLALRRMDQLIIDEVSMVPADMFSAIDQVLRRIRESDLPFGGVQVVLFGDPYQLEPVVKERSLKEWYSDVLGSPYFFSSRSWAQGRFLKVQLQGALRQEQGEFLEALDCIRTGKASIAHVDMINERLKREEEIPTSGVVRLSPTNSLVDRFNSQKLSEISGKPFTYVGVMNGDFERQKDRLPAPEHLQLKVGAQVMMLSNETSGLWVNGSMATVAELGDNAIHIEINHSIHAVRQFTWDRLTHSYNRAEARIDRKVEATYTQYAMCLGWARTIHKSQGQTYEQCAVDFGSGMFTFGQAYVALSRCKSIEGLYLTRPLRHEDILVAEIIDEFMSDLTPAMQLKV